MISDLLVTRFSLAQAPRMVAIASQASLPLGLCQYGIGDGLQRPLLTLLVKGVCQEEEVPSTWKPDTNKLLPAGAAPNAHLGCEHRGSRLSQALWSNASTFFVPV